MNKVLIVTLGIKSHLYTHLGFAERAGDLGWEVAISSPSEQIRDVVESAGYQFYALKPAHGRMRSPPSVARVRSFKQEKAKAQKRRRAIFSGLGLPEVFAANDPDLVIIDSELHEYILVALAQKQSTIVFEPHFSTERRPNVPVLSSTFVPSDGLISRLHCWAGWKLLQVRRFTGRVFQKLVFGPDDKHTVIKKLAAENDVGPSGIFDTGQWHFYDFPNLTYIRCTVPDIDFSPGSVRSNHLFLGPMIRRETKDSRELDTLAAVDEFLANESDGKPVVLVTFGSIQTLKSRVQCAIDAARGKNISMLVACPDTFVSNGGNDIPDNVFVADWLPIVPILQKIDVAVTHGGPATIQECIDAGVPMLLYSMDVRDQNGNVARVCGKGMGLAGSGGDSADGMWRKISRLLHEESFSNRCKEMAATYARYDARETFEAQISSLLGDNYRK